MALPFDTEQFLAVFAAYNAAIWPAPVAAYGLGLAALGALWCRPRLRRRVIPAVLAVLWAWNGLGYQLAFFAPVNPAAYGFAALFGLQALLLARAAASASGPDFALGPGWRSAAAIALVVYAMVVYPAIGAAAGRGGMQGPLFGVAPCPTTIFTIGLLLTARGRGRAVLSVIPILWAAIGTSAAWLLGMPEDLGLGIAGGALAVALVFGDDPGPGGRAQDRAGERAER